MEREIMENQCNYYLATAALIFFLAIGGLIGVTLTTETVARSCNENGQFKDLNGQIYECKEKYDI